MSELRISVSGTPRVLHAGQPLILPTRKTLALLLYLAIEGGRHSRSSLSRLLWPDSEEKQRQATLRGALRDLRHALGEVSSVEEPHLLIYRDALEMNVRHLQVDVQKVQAQVAALSDHPAQTALIDLTESLAACRGPFLDGWDMGDLPSFDEWIQVQRTYWRREIDSAYALTSRHFADQGLFSHAETVTRQWIRQSPHNEEAHFRLVQLLYVQGKVSTAIEVYETYRASLQQEGSMRPPADVTALVDQIRKERAGAQGRKSLPSPEAHAILDLPLVGRRAELEALQNLHVQAASGNIQVALIEGEAGIGKTRLATEFLHWARLQRTQTLYGRCYETHEALPYGPLIEALRMRLEQEHAPDDLLADIWLTELSRLFPELLERYPDLPPPLADGQDGAGRLFEAMAQLGLALSQKAPLILAIDDLQWVDHATRNLLIYAIRRWEELGARLLLVLITRTETPGTLSSLQDELARLVPVHHLQLRSLRIVDVHALVHLLSSPLLSAQSDDGPTHQATTAQMDSHVGDWLFAETEGQPLFLVQTIRELAERGMLKLRTSSTGHAYLDSQATASVLATLSDILPTSIRDLIRLRLGRLSPSALEVLVATAVLASQATFEHLARVSDQTETICLRAVDEGLQSHLLQEQSSQGRLIYSTTHDKIRAVVLAEARESRRRVFHRRALTVLQESKGSATELMHHALQAGQWNEAFRYGMQAGDEAMAVFAPTDAQSYYQQAQALTGRELGVTDEEIGRLFVHLSRALEAQGQWDEAKTILLDLLTTARRLASRRLVIEAHIRLATFAIQTNDPSDARTRLQNALVLAEELGEASSQAAVLWNLAQLYVLYDDIQVGVRYGERAVALAQETNIPTLLANSCAALSIAYVWSGRFADAIAFARRGHEVIKEMGQQGKETSLVANTWAGTTLIPTTSYAAIGAFCLNVMLAAQINAGRPVTARSEAEAALTDAYVHHNAITIVHLATNLSHVSLDMGNYERARTFIVEALQQIQLIQQLPLLFLWAKRGYAGALMGLWEEAEHALLKADEIALQYFPHWRSIIVPIQCALAVFQGDWTRAEQLALLAHELRQAMGTPLVLEDFMRWHETQALLHSGHADLARADVEGFERLVGESRRHRLVLLRMQAVLAAYDGDAPGAVTTLIAAQTLAQEIGLPGELWQLHAAHGDLLREMGQGEQARVAYTQANALLDDLAGRFTDETLRTAFLSSPLARHVHSQAAM